jgi:hypothetical protein
MIPNKFLSLFLFFYPGAEINLIKYCFQNSTLRYSNLNPFLDLKEDFYSFIRSNLKVKKKKFYFYYFFNIKNIILNK